MIYFDAMWSARHVKWHDSFLLDRKNVHNLLNRCIKRDVPQKPVGYKPSLTSSAVFESQYQGSPQNLN